jgi:hypothetical protein
LKEYISDNKIDIFGIHKTKVETLPSRTLNFLSSSISSWFFKPSYGNSLSKVLDTFELEFSLTIKLENKKDSFIWYYSSIWYYSCQEKKNSKKSCSYIVLNLKLDLSVAILI